MPRNNGGRGWSYTVACGSGVKNLPSVLETWRYGFNPSVGKTPLPPTPEEEMATYSGILAWEIPWTEEPRGLQSMGLQRG